MFQICCGGCPATPKRGALEVVHHHDPSHHDHDHHPKNNNNNDENKTLETSLSRSSSSSTLEKTITTTNIHSKKTAVLLEIVGAVGLHCIHNFYHENVESFCVVKINGKEVHRTKTITNDTSPIWTIKTKSLCLLALEKDNNETITIDLLCYPKKVIPVTTDLNIVSSMIAETTVVGRVELSYQDIVHQEEEAGKRREFPLWKGEKGMEVSLALRYRKATTSDVLYFRDIQKTSSNRFHTPLLRPTSERVADFAGDIDFQSVTQKRLLSRQTKTIINDEGHKELAFRVWPFPDPESPKETKFMTTQQLKKAALQPSKTWVQAGDGNFGTVHLEILGCDNLPNLDNEFMGKTDAFVGCVFESSFVRTAVIHDTLHPRWMPWSHRAFMFKIRHPSSLLFLGVFDYDRARLDDHDPIGRVVVRLETFEQDTVYTLNYPLYGGDTQDEEPQGTISIRLRVHWNNELATTRAESFTQPPVFMINVSTAKSWRVLRYITRGALDMGDSTVAAVKLYVYELIGYYQRYCYLFDVLMEILLWRGRLTLKLFRNDISLWFPMHSCALFACLAFGTENPSFIPALFLYVIAYTLLWNNYNLSHHPSPWSRVRPFARFLRWPSHSSGVRIESDTGAKESKVLEQLEIYRTYRVTGFLYEIIYIALGVYRVYSKNSPMDISTVPKNRGSLFTKLYANYLSYLHLVLRQLCLKIRLLRNFVNWKVYSTYKVTFYLLVVATAWCVFPYKYWAHWVIRLFVWSCFGPWAKLLDIFWIHKYYRTDEELIRDGIPDKSEDEMKEDIASRPNILEPLLESGWVQTMGKSGRVVVEDHIKLRDFRELCFGKYNERVPLVDDSRFPSIPLDSSHALPYNPNMACPSCPTTTSTNNLTSATTNDSNKDVSGESGQESHKKNEDCYYHDIPTNLQTWEYLPGQKLYGCMIPKQYEDDSCPQQQKYKLHDVVDAEKFAKATEPIQEIPASAQ